MCRITFPSQSQQQEDPGEVESQAFMLIITIWGSLDSPVTLTFMSLNWRRKPEKEHPDSTQNTQRLQAASRSDPGASC